jgi:predicted secreted protein
MYSIYGRAIGDRTVVQVDENSNGDQIKLASGETLEIGLSENRTTGYKWFLKSSGKVCTLVDDGFEPGRAPGEPGTHRWKFRAEQAGSGSIQLSYHRTWGKEKTPASTFKLTVLVS